ncbi:DUF4333 domain-containing protein [Actinopolyspora sp. H202]|uniref:DUF4333 domain-containing protein n=1 Tax=Actinopolyspora sp. H202 TaxID=1500456 RepID=UPI003EE7B7DA
MSNPYGSSPHRQSNERHRYGSPAGRSPGGWDGASAFAGRRRRRVWPWLLGSVTLLSALVVAVLGFVTPGWFYRTVLEADSVQQGVRQIARDSYGVDGIESVICPEGEPLRAGHSFTCEMRVGGVSKNVRIVIRDEKGTYSVGRPD